MHLTDQQVNPKKTIKSIFQLVQHISPKPMNRQIAFFKKFQFHNIQGFTLSIFFPLLQAHNYDLFY
jgi:hypothetical protein